MIASYYRRGTRPSFSHLIHFHPRHCHYYSLLSGLLTLFEYCFTNQINSFAFLFWRFFKSCSKSFPFSSADDADSYRDRLKVLRMRAGLDNGANAESKVCVHLFAMRSIPQNLWLFYFPLLNIYNLENGKGRPACP